MLNLEKELAGYKELAQIKTLVEQKIITPAEAITVCNGLDFSGAPLIAHKTACLLDYFRALSE